MGYGPTVKLFYCFALAAALAMIFSEAYGQEIDQRDCAVFADAAVVIASAVRHGSTPQQVSGLVDDVYTFHAPEARLLVAQLQQHAFRQKAQIEKPTDWGMDFYMKCMTGEHEKFFGSKI